MTKQQKSSTIVPNMVASKDKDVYAVPNLNNLADCAFKSQEDAVIDTLDECEQTTPPDSVSVSKMVMFNLHFSTMIAFSFMFYLKVPDLDLDG